MSVHCLPDARWICKFPPGTLHDQPKKTKTYFGRGPDAERAAHEYNDKLGLGVRRLVRTPVFTELAEAYLAGKVGVITDTTAHRWRVAMSGTILPRVGAVMAHDITPEFLDRYVAERSKTVKKNSIHREISNIRAVLRWAVKRKMLASNPMANYEMPANVDMRIRPPSKAELGAILANSAPHLKRAILLAYNTGLRPGREELFSLQWSSVDLIGQTINVSSAAKGGIEERVVPLSASFTATLSQWYDEDERAGMRYLVHYRGGKVTSIQAAWNAAKQRARITRRLRLYDLRHCFASVLLSKGADLRSVSELLGHRSVAMTMQVYQHVSGDLKRRAVALLDDLGTQVPSE
jgi:integrase